MVATSALTTSASRTPALVPSLEAASRCTRRALLAGASAASGLALAACGSRSGPSEGAPAPGAPGPATVSFAFWGSEERADLVAREVVPLFKSRYPQIDLQLVHNPTQHKQKLVTMFAGGTPPDVPAID